MSHITLLGMGPISVSIGFGLKRAGLNMEIVGTDRNRGPLHQASKMGAIDRATGNLRSAMDGAQLVVLDAPLADTKELLEAIAPILDEGCVVTDIGTSKVPVMGWAEECMREGTSFVAGHPLLKDPVASIDDAHAELFDGTEYCVIPTKTATPDAVKTVVGMVESLGARPLFLDAHEHDSYAAALAHMPLVVSSAVVSATTASVSWREASRVAGAEFRGVTQLASNDPSDSASACLANPDALVHWLDRLIAELGYYRDQVKEGGDGLLETFIDAWEQRAKWEAGAIVEEQGPEIPSAGEHMAGMLVGQRWAERSRKMTKDDKRPPWKFPRRS